MPIELVPLSSVMNTAGGVLGLDSSGKGPSSRISYTQNGDGAIDRLIEDKAHESVSVADFGATGDGVTDDTAAIKAAIASARVSSRRIMFGAGTFRISETLNLKDMLTLEGEAGSIVSNSDWPTTLVFDDGIVGIFLHRFNTDADETGDPSIVEGTVGADGTILRHLRIIRGDGSAPATFDGKHGVWAKARFAMENCLISGFGGDGIYVAANTAATTDPLMLGNANNFSITNTRIQNSAGAGFQCLGLDANVGLLTKVDSTNNGRQGFLDASFLGTTFLCCHTANNGGHSQVSHGGNRYFVLNNTTGGATTPGTNAAVWELVGAGGVSTEYPAWAADADYFRGSAFETSNANACSAYLGCYAEGSQPHSFFAARTLVFGGLIGGLERGSLAPVVLGSESSGLLLNKAITSQITDPATSVTTRTSVGGDPAGGLILYASDSTSTPDGFRMRFNGADIDLRYSNLASRSVQKFTGPNTTLQLGSTITKPFYSVFERIAIGAGNNAREHTAGTAAPSTGTWGRGSICYNISPAASGYVGWVCVTAGSPGTWKGFGLIES